MFSLEHVPATRSVCRFNIREKEDEYENAFVYLECQSATAQEIKHEMEILLYNRTERLFIGSLNMSRNNITELDAQTFQYKELEGVVGLYLDQNQISKLPGNLFHSQALTSVKIVNLSRNNIRCLSSTQFEYLERLSSLDLSYNELDHYGLPQGVFTSIRLATVIDLDLVESVFPNLIRLDLSHNKISFLPDGLFEGKGLTDLVTLSLHHNNLSDIPRCIFTSNFLISLSGLFLHHNFINQIPPSSPLSESTLINLNKLNLEFNQLETISADLFDSRNWTSLKRLVLDNNNISRLPDAMFSSRYLGKLEHISFSHNSMEELPGNSFFNSCLTSLKYLSFSHNMIKILPVNFFYLETYFSVFPHTCNCSEMHQCPPFEGLTHVDLSFNQISHIPIGFFRPLKNLKEIKLNNNMINTINVTCFPDSFEHLQILDLSYNFINSPIIEIFTLALSSKELNPSLNVSHNQLTVQESFLFVKNYRCLFQTFYLDLSYNNISKISGKKLYFYYPVEEWTFNDEYFKVEFESKLVLDKVKAYVSGNHILDVNRLVQATLFLDLNDLKWPMYKKTAVYGLILQLYSFIKTFHYSYHCNCDMLKYLRLQETKIFKQSLLRVNEDPLSRRHGYVARFRDFNYLLCGTPAELAGKYLYDLKPEELQCHDSNCTDSVKCSCTYTPANYTVKFNCTGKRLKYIPSITKNESNLEVYFGFNDLKRFPVISLHVSCKITVLDLSYNSIDTILKDFFTHYPKIHKLNLAGNLLKDLPLIPEWNHLNTLNYLELRENHFICNCSGLSLKKTLISLNKRVTISDIDKITCYGPEKVKNKVIYDAPDSLFGCPFLNMVLILILVFTFLLFIVILLFIAYVFRDYIKLFLFIHFGWRFFYTYQKEETQYDVFVSYSFMDSDWVEERLMKPLEGLDPPYNLCLHERDFQVGIPICDNITRAIEGSKCTLVVVSRNWLESDWCQFEFRVAHCLATVEKKSRLIVLLKEKIPADEIKGDLELYIKTFTYLDSTNKLFWPRLLTDLPEPNINEVENQNDAHESDDIELIHVM